MNRIGRKNDNMVNNNTKVLFTKIKSKSCIYLCGKPHNLLNKKSLKRLHLLFQNPFKVS